MKRKTMVSKSSIDEVFKKLEKKGEKAFIPFITCGYPDLDSFFKLYDVLERNGADIIEIGIPFSDPLADGPVIQETSKIAIENGINTDIVFDSILKIREKSNTPVVILTYFNTVYRYGIENFLKKASDNGANGVIIADLPFEEFYHYMKYFNLYNIDNIMLASLTSTHERLCKISSICRGFLYCVSVKGVTGIREGVRKEVIDFLVKLKKITALPLAVGFGISSPDQIIRIKDYCDAVIIGSKILSIIRDASDIKDGFRILENFIYKINIILKSKK